MRILQIINALTFGGAQFLLLDLAREAQKAGHQVVVACFRDGPIGDTLRQEGFKVEILGETFLDLPAMYRLTKLFKAFRPDVVHSHLFRATFWARLICRKISQTRLVTSIHGCETDFFHHIEKFMSRFTDFLIFPSNFLRDWYSDNFRKLHNGENAVIYPGVNIRPAIPPANEQTPITIGTLSRLHPVKGIDRLILACADLKKQKVPFNLLIGGNGKHKQKLVELVQKVEIDDCCTFVGEICDRDVFLSKLDLFVAPSRQEAFGIHICEAMERGLPVVGAGVGGIPELVEHEKTGLLFAADSIESLSESLKRMINEKNLRQKAGENSRIKVEQQFNRHTATDRHLKIYEHLTGNLRKLHFAISSSELGGGERLALGIMRALKLRGWQISATCGGEPLYTAIKSEEIGCSACGMRAGGIFFALKLLHDLIIIRPSLLNTHLNRASLIGGVLGRMLGIATVSHVHGLNQKSYYSRSDALVAVSQAVNEHMIRQKADSSKLTTIANCIDKVALSARQLSPDQLTISITAKLHYNKGHQWALAAIADHMDQLGNIRVLIIGDGPERSALEDFCRQKQLHSIVRFMGFMNNPEDLYNAVDIALLPSLGEGIPLSLLETMRWGIPCIASNIGGIPEIITHNYNGLLVSPKNAEELIKALQSMRDPQQYAKFSSNAIAAFKRLNDYEKMITSLEQLFARTIAEKA